MDLRMRLTRKRVALLGAVAALATAVGVAYATIPSAGGVFTACVMRSTGAVRIIDPSGPASSPGSHCAASERKITWNQHGQAGKAGKAGVPGQNGATGAIGPAGPTGAPGAAGA